MLLKKNTEELLRRLMGEGLYEIRALLSGGKTYNNTQSVLFNKWEVWDKSLRAKALLLNKSGNVFFTLNPVLDALTGRETYSESFVAPSKGDSVSDRDIKSRRWLLIDLDPKRPAGISSSDEEKAHAWDTAQEIKEFLHRHEFLDPIICDSGNGFHLLYRIDLKNNDESAKLVKSILEILSEKFDNEYVDIDKSVFNASRIVKLYGTYARKGRNDTENGRPHRKSGFIEFPENAENAINPLSVLEILVHKHNLAEKRMESDKNEAGFTKSMAFIRNLIEEHGLNVKEEAVPSGDGVKFFFHEGCPFNSEHKGKDSYVHIKANGARIFKCSHNSDSDKGWKEFVRLFDESYKTFEERRAEENVLGEVDDFLNEFDRKPDVPQNGPKIDSAGLSVGEVMSRLEKGKKGNVIQNIANNLFVLRNDPELRNVIRFNTLTNLAENAKTNEVWGDGDDSRVMMRLQSVYGLSTRTHYFDAVAIRKDETKYHPVRQLISSVKWDGTPRIETALTKYLNARDTKYTRFVSRLLFVSAVKRVFNPGCKYDTMPVLVGSQGGGKSTFCKRMALREEFFSDSIRGIGSKEALEQMEGVWIAEWGEMSAMRRAKDCESVKLFISQTEDKGRKAYARNVIVKKRECVFVGTTNEMDGFLTDGTGNRRFLPVEVGEGNSALWDEPTVIREFEQMMAEAKVIVDKGVSLYVPHEMADSVSCEQEKYEEEDPKEGIIQSWLSSHPEIEETCTKQIWDELFAVNGSHPTRGELRHISQILRRRNFGEPTGVKWLGVFGTQRVWKINHEAVNPDSLDNL